MFSDKGNLKDKPCLSRRSFLLMGGSSVVLTSVPGLATALDGLVKSYPRKKIAKVSELEDNKQIYFRYPQDDSIQCHNFLVKVGTAAGGGVGKKQDIVAFNSYCPHMGGPLNGLYNAEHQVAGPCPLHLSTFDLTRHGMVVSGHATESLPQILLEIKGDDIYAIGVMGLIYGHHDNLNV